MQTATAWDDHDRRSGQDRGWTVMGKLRQQQYLRRKKAMDARQRIARQSEAVASCMVPTSGDLLDFVNAEWRGGPIVLAFLFAPPDSDAIHMLDTRGGYFDIRTGNTWDLFFPGYYRSTEDSASECEKGALQVGTNFTKGWYFDPAGFNDLRAHIESASEYRWQYSGGADLVLINGWIGEQGTPTIDWVSTISGQITDKLSGVQTLTLANAIERITRDIETQAEDGSYGVGDVTDGPADRSSHVGRDFMVQALSGIAAALVVKQFGA